MDVVTCEINYSWLRPFRKNSRHKESILRRGKIAQQPKVEKQATYTVICSCKFVDIMYNVSFAQITDDGEIMFEKLYEPFGALVYCAYRVLMKSS